MTKTDIKYCATCEITIAQLFCKGIDSKYLGFSGHIMSLPYFLLCYLFVYWLSFSRESEPMEGRWREKEGEIIRNWLM